MPGPNPIRLGEIHSLIIDVDGVLWRGSHPLPGVPRFLDFLSRRNVNYTIATNNSARPTLDIIERLERMGAKVDAARILTSAEATAMYLPRLAPVGSRVFLVGGKGIAEALVRAGYLLVDRDADVVVAGVDFDLTYERLKRATLEIRRGALFVGTNSDRTFPTDEGLIPGAGAILAAIAAATDVKPIVVGKPEQPMFDMALEKMGACRESTAMLGDRLDTDIEGATRAGLGSILVLTGVTMRDQLAASPIRPDFVFKDLDALHAVWERELSTY